MMTDSENAIFNRDIDFNDLLKDDGEDISCNLDSQYYDLYESEFDSLISTVNDFKVLHYNIQGFPTKFDNFKIMLEQLKCKGIIFDIIMICEVWIHENEKGKYVIENYRKIIELFY